MWGFCLCELLRMRSKRTVPARVREARKSMALPPKQPPAPSIRRRNNPQSPKSAGNRGVSLSVTGWSGRAH